MRKILVILFFVCAMIAVFIGGYRSAEKTPRQVINNVTVIVPPSAATAAPRKNSAPPKIEKKPAPVAVERNDADSPRADIAPAATTNEASAAVPTPATTDRDIEPVAPPMKAAGPLKISYPKPMFVGTPVPIRLKNIEPPHPAKPWEFELPEGSFNLARGKAVTASDSAPLLGSLDLITDGDKSAEEGSYVELAGGKQWVQIDLGKTSDIFCLLIWHYHLQSRAYKAVVVQISDDPDFARNVKTVFNNDIDNACGLGAGTDYTYVESYLGKLIDTKGAKGRYLRLWSDGNTSNGMNHYIEVEAYGR